MLETGRVIHKRYLLQRLIKQGQVCSVYQGSDRVLQRTVAVKVVPASHISAYRAAIRATSQFSHPNIIGIYDLIVESEALYVVQEYVDGDNFSHLLQIQLLPHEVVDIGVQICQALLYASSASRKLCHGDLTPCAIMRDRHGLVHVNNFALPSDLSYFTSWSTVGGSSIGGVVLADPELPWGQLSNGRHADDTRAAGLLLYQLLAGRASGATSVEPPADGRLRFIRNVPVELCEVIARSTVPQHPQYINTVEALYSALKTLEDTLDPPLVASTAGVQQAEDMIKAPAQPSAGKLATALPVRETAQTSAGVGLSSYPPDTTGAQMAAMDPPFAPSAPTVADIPVRLTTARQAAYPERSLQERQTERGGQSVRHLSLPLLLLIGLVVFTLFFVVGYFVANFVLPH